MTAPGRYCPPRICWCGDCAWWEPIPPVDYSKVAGSTASTARQHSSWTARDEPTWIDDL